MAEWLSIAVCCQNTRIYFTTRMPYLLLFNYLEYYYLLYWPNEFKRFDFESLNRQFRKVVSTCASGFVSCLLNSTPWVCRYRDEWRWWWTAPAAQTYNQEGDGARLEFRLWKRRWRRCPLSTSETNEGDSHSKPHSVDILCGRVIISVCPFDFRW